VDTQDDFADHQSHYVSLEVSVGYLYMLVVEKQQAGDASRVDEFFFELFTVHSTLFDVYQDILHPILTSWWCSSVEERRSLMDNHLYG